MGRDSFRRPAAAGPLATYHSTGWLLKCPHKRLVGADCPYCDSAWILSSTVPSIAKRIRAVLEFYRKHPDLAGEGVEAVHMLRRELVTKR